MDASEEIANARWLVEQRMVRGRGASAPDPLCELLDKRRVDIVEWLRRRTALADGTDIGVPVAAPGAVAVALRRLGSAGDPAAVTGAGIDPHAVHVALLRTLCGLRWPDIARATNVGRTAAHLAADVCARRMQTDPAVAALIGSIAAEAIERTIGAARARRSGATTGGADAEEGGVRNRRTASAGDEAAIVSVTGVR